VTRPLRLVWIYPDLLSTYGDRGNLLVLERRARLRGLPAEVAEVNSNQPVPRDGDIYLMGGGEDLPQTLATRRLQADGGLHEAANRGAVVFAVCAGYQVLGTEFGGADGAQVPGLGLLDIRSGRGERRAVGEIVADVDPALNVPRLTGFENHQGVTRLGPQAPTCTARRSCATPASPTCCCTGPPARSRRCHRTPRNWRSAFATSASPRSAPSQ
jgi:CobQ-like glutamine amidotransferase family enzyme